MATNQIKTFAAGAGANVLTQAEYEALSAILANGFTSGVLPSEYLNKALRQALFPAAALGEIIKGNGVDALDDGDLATFVTRLKAALNASPALTGTPTAPTAAPGTNTAQLATTAFVAASSAIAASETVSGIAKLATQATTNTGTNDTDFVTPKKLRGGLLYSIATNGYVAFPTWIGGFIIQWGRASLGSQASLTVTLPVTHPNAGLQLVVSDYQNVTSVNYAPSGTFLSTSQISISNSDTGAAVVSWLSIGW